MGVNNIIKDIKVLFAEIVKHYLPKLVEIHNYPVTHNSKQKKTNWKLLNVKVLKKLGLIVEEKDIEKIINYEEGIIESYIKQLRDRVRSLTLLTR